MEDLIFVLGWISLVGIVVFVLVVGGLMIVGYLKGWE